MLLLFALQLTFMAAVLSLTDQALKGNPSKCGAFLIQARDRIEGPMADGTRCSRVKIRACQW